MRSTRLASTLLSAAILAPRAFAAAQPLPPSVAAVASNNTAFACDLYAQLKTQDGNLFFSPYSVSTALAMTYAGARGETAAQMAKALHFSLPQAELHPAFAALAAQMNAVQTAGHVKLSIANSLWPYKTYPFLEDYLALVKKNYGSTITPVDYEHAEPAARAQINQWVEDKTQKKITNIIGAPLDPLTRLVLVNAVYFKGTWESPFKAEETKNAPFHRPVGDPVQTPLMTHTRTYKYGEWQTVQVIELPYAGNELSMLVLLPSSTNGMAELEGDLSVSGLQQWRQQLRLQKVQLFLPKFKITWGAALLNNALQALGMSDAFNATRADFSGMDGRPDLLISRILQKAFVDVNEEGTEAAAATAITMHSLAISRPRPPPVFRADHPFLFLIQENATGSILFMGRVTDPMAQ